MPSRPPVTPVRQGHGGFTYGTSSSQTAAVPPPQGNAEPGRQLAKQLNQKYGLGLKLDHNNNANVLRSPAEHEQLARADAALARQNRILQLLRLHHYKGAARLQAALGEFDKVAAVQARSRGRPGPAALQEALLGLLETSRAALMQEMQAARAHGQGTTNARPAATTQKTYNPPAIAADIDQAPMRQRPGAPALPPPPPPAAVTPAVTPAITPAITPAVTPAVTTTTHQAVESWMRGEGSGHAAQQLQRPSTPASSTTNSSDMFSALDSFEAVPPTQDTDDDGYTTENMTEDELPPPLLLHRVPSNESFAASDGLLEAFEESFSQLQLSAGDVSSSVPDVSSLRIADEPLRINAPATPATPARKTPVVPGLRDRLDNIFPPMPAWLRGAPPFPIVWETTRIAMRCGVDLAQDVVWEPPTYTPAWDSQPVFRAALAGHALFRNRRLPEPLPEATWKAAMGGGPSAFSGTTLGIRRVAVYTIQLHFSETARRGTTPRGSSSRRINDLPPLYRAQLLPIATDLPHRLGRHYGPDRFVEVLLPSHHSSRSAVPRMLWEHDAAVHEVNAWLTRQRHALAGRQWAAFYVKDGGLDKKKRVADGHDGPAGMQPGSSSTNGSGDETLIHKRVYLFAEKAEKADDDDGGDNSLAPLSVYDMLDWLLRFNAFPANRAQPYLKLFSRISLGLSRTKPALVFQPHQIRHQPDDVRSPTTNAVMNDGIGRMSLSVARRLRSVLELSDLPTAVQGRLGSAKGMWILDTLDDGRADWIETYPSQRKWSLENEADEDQRTLEIRHFASAIGRSSRLNLQFLPLVEDRAVDKPRMRRTLARILAGDLTRDLAAQRAALHHPLLLAAWVQDTARMRTNHLAREGKGGGGHVPFLGGRPDSDEDTIQFLLAGGFDPLQQQYLWEMVYGMQQTRCQRLQSSLSVRVGRAAHLLMVVDFLGVLEEGEVQVCFSSKFSVDPDVMDDGDGDDFESDDDCADDGSFSDTLLVGMDVLVARSPAHFPGDMQRVRAVFHPALSALKDVVIFSTKGDSPLADKLSGGDYDGDMAWVCWDPRLVGNFANAPPHEPVSLREMGYMSKISTTMEELGGSYCSESEGADSSPKYPAPALDDLLEQSFAFNMRDNLLGRVTAYKEKLCYLRGSIADRSAILLSSLLSDLVDQAKQGNVFGSADFDRLRRECLGGVQVGSNRPPPAQLPAPAYKPGGHARARRADSIIDFLKFKVADPIVERELTALEHTRQAMSQSSQNDKGGTSSAFGFYDMDLAAPARHFEALAAASPACRTVLASLRSDIRDVTRAWSSMTAEWQRGSSDAEDNYPQRVLAVYHQWCAIGPRCEKDTLAWLQPDHVDPLYSPWALLRASETFRMLWRRQPRLLWSLAGRQLQAIKAVATAATEKGGGGVVDGTSGAKVVMTPLMYAANKPDGKTIKRMAARLAGGDVDGDDDDGDDFFYDADDGYVDDT